MVTSSSWIFLAAVVAGCGSGPGARTPETTASGGAAIALEPKVASQVWYRALSTCGQGPYEIEVPVAGVRWGEEFELRLATPRRVALHAVIIADDDEVAKEAAVFGQGGRADGKPENVRCVADARERVIAGRVVGTTTGTPATPGRWVKDPPPPGPPPPKPSVTSQLEIDSGEPPASIQIVRFGWREHDQRHGRIRIRLWSVEPNDLDGVRFGVARIEWRPNISEADYLAYLARIEEAREEAARRAIEQLRREEEQRRLHPPPVAPVVTVHIDAKAELERSRKEEEARRRRAAEIARKEEEARRRREAEAERARRRQQFCTSHPEDRGCWGAGGMRVHLDFDNRIAERAAYCSANPNDARCWSDGERVRRQGTWQGRVDVALAPPRQPDGPPPDPLAETRPPKLSVNAEWRDGYWLWTGTTWVWLAGMWRVPEADIVAEQTTVAPVAPPPPRTEAIPPPPMVTTVWVTGFWQWNGTGWVWIPGSYQAREAGASWRPAEWQARGTRHVLIPGAWVRIHVGGGR